MFLPNTLSIFLYSYEVWLLCSSKQSRCICDHMYFSINLLCQHSSEANFALFYPVRLIEINRDEHRARALGKSCLILSNDCWHSSVHVHMDCFFFSEWSDAEATLPSNVFENTLHQPLKLCCRVYKTKRKTQELNSKIVLLLLKMQSLEYCQVPFPTASIRSSNLAYWILMLHVRTPVCLGSGAWDNHPSGFLHSVLDNPHTVLNHLPFLDTMTTGDREKSL